MSRIAEIIDRRCETGNNVPESNHKTRRTWLPNIQWKSLYSATLNEHIRLKVVSAVLRDIDKVGGLDQYLLKESFQEVLGDKGQQLKQRVMTARKSQEAKAVKQQKQQAILNSPVPTDQMTRLLDGGTRIEGHRRRNAILGSNGTQGATL